MTNYKLTDTWQLEEAYTLTESELLKLAYDLYCNSYSDEEMKKAKEKFDSDIPKTIAYIEKECGWKAEEVQNAKLQND